MFFRYLRAVMLGVVASALVACAHIAPPLADQQADPVYRLGGGDEIRVITYGSQDLTAQFHVSDDGYIAMPLLGNVQAAGKTPTELSADIANALVRKGLVNNPSVSVEILTYRPIFLLGEVTRPGQYPFQPGMTVQQAVAMAGGFTYRAIDDKVNLTRRQGHEGNPIVGSVPVNAVLQPGDTVNVLERTF
jgi:polysaccharide export outer membrane protein